MDIMRDENELALDIKMDGMMTRKGELPDDLACFLQQQKQRQARLETTMRSFPTKQGYEDDKLEIGIKRKRNTNEDPMSHRIIEKRRRDRMNNCLADLSRLIPSSYLKKGRGRIEKTEIIEMTIKHMKHLQQHPCNKPEGCDIQTEIAAGLTKTSSLESFRVGYHECLTELMHFLVEKQGLYSGDTFCVRMMSHLQKHFDRLGRASTSEIHSTVGGTWAGAGLPSETHPSEEGKYRKRKPVSSEYGTTSEESGYGSFQQEDGSSIGKDETDPWRPIVTQEDKVKMIPAYRDKVDQDQDDVTTGMYKFKSNIRHRFDMGTIENDDDQLEIEERPFVTKEVFPGNTEGHIGTVEDKGPGKIPIGEDDIKRRFIIDEKDDLVLPYPRASPFSDPPSSSSNIKTSASPCPPFIPPVAKPSGQLVPIFALNYQGSYYVPLSIDLGLLSPHVHLLTEGHQGPMHPVTISVNCGGPETTVGGSGIGLGETKREEERDWRNRGHGVIQQPSVIKQWRQESPN